ncbi:MAG: phosphatase PAP2 family protein [Gemmatimonadales bacterium]|nr:phosphatase PAP2 family protein [Gemmatimonadales bacterium]
MLPARRLSLPAALLLLAFVAISTLVVAGYTHAWDAAVLTWIGTVRTPAMIDLMVFFTVLGDGEVEIPLALGLVVLLWRLGRRLEARRYLFSALSAEVVFLIAKASFQRPRPDLITKLANAGWYSYPSGHAMLAPVIWGAGLLLMARAVRHPAARGVLVTLAVVLPVLIAVSRVYL